MFVDPGWAVSLLSFGKVQDRQQREIFFEQQSRAALRPTPGVLQAMVQKKTMARIASLIGENTD